VAELVHAMGGTVRAESPLLSAGGTRMVVTLPTWSDARPGGGATVPGDRVSVAEG
jgi:signal transduction histidine kinase